MYYLYKVTMTGYQQDSHDVLKEMKTNENIFALFEMINEFVSISEFSLEYDSASINLTHKRDTKMRFRISYKSISKPFNYMEDH